MPSGSAGHAPKADAVQFTTRMPTVNEAVTSHPDLRRERTEALQNILCHILDSIYYHPLTRSGVPIINKKHDTYLSPPSAIPIHPCWRVFCGEDGSNMPRNPTVLCDVKEATFWEGRIAMRE